ncbi:glycoside hydrolase family 88 protein [Sphaerisporangium flaviroseum]|uniref:glycoside hydrolase family 88 protein n=1 Tax=Sphaerisporangium flaviroseum TaxID=509199 RepID=UPI0031F04B5A
MTTLRLALTLALATLAVPLAHITTVQAAVTRYEAEDATISRGAVESDHPGFTGTGFVNYDNLTGSYVDWTVDSPQARTVTLTLRYANGTTTDRPMDISVNGTVISTARPFNGTGSWTSWATNTLTVSLAAGNNHIRATATTANGGPNVDSLTVDDQAPPATDWSKAVVESTMARFTPSSIGGWSYPVGLYLYGQHLVYQRTRDPRYLQYIKNWADRFVDGSGNISQSFNNLDSMEAGNVLLILWQETGQAKYRTAAQKIRNRLNTYPRTSDGGFWHSTSDSRQGQLWADGVFMVNPFLARYGRLFNDSTYADNEVARQLLVYAAHLKRSSGLLYHAYDEPGGLTASWVHPEFGDTNGISWCRAIGWYGMAVSDVLEILPASHPQRATLIGVVRDLVAAFARYQDPATGRWFQVVDQGSDSGNWTETSCSAMYTFTISRAVERGYVDASYKANATRGYQGVLQKVSIGSDGRTNVSDICIGTNVDDVTGFYFNRPRATNDFHGLGAFLIMNEQLTRT